MVIVKVVTRRDVRVGISEVDVYCCTVLHIPSVCVCQLAVLYSEVRDKVDIYRAAQNRYKINCTGDVYICG